MSASVPGPKAADPTEGYVKYRCAHTPGPAPRHAGLAELDGLRTELFDAGLVGVLPGGVGFGNLSVREAGGAFVITATGTGGARVLGPDGYCRVTACDVDGNFVHSCGPRQASSEAMSHGAVYAAGPDVGCVVHVHSRALFDGLLADAAPATPPGAAYGTPAMARAVAEVVARHPDEGVLVMGGHDEGVLAYGPGVARVAALLANVRRRYLM